MASQAEMKAKLKELMENPENMKCLDCNDKRPMWASLIVPPKNAPFKEPLGCFCCYQCSGAHRRMGVHICFVRSTNLDECKFLDFLDCVPGQNSARRFKTKIVCLSNLFLIYILLYPTPCYLPALLFSKQGKKVK